jgi:hypothetical protein
LNNTFYVILIFHLCCKSNTIVIFHLCCKSNTIIIFYDRQKCEHVF